MSSRHKDLTKNQDFPAANHYNPKERFTSDSAPCFTMKSRHEFKTTANDTPGVGSYNVCRNNKTNGISLSSRWN